MSERLVHLVRHGETGWNKEFRVQGTTDIPLSEEGERQARELIPQLKEIKFDRVYTSVLRRAIQTAEIALDGAEIPLHRHGGLNERRFGEYEGKTWAEIDAQYGEGALNNRDPLGGETREEFELRVNGTLDEILANHLGETILIVTHGGTVREIKKRLDIAAAHVDGIGYEIANCSVMTFEIPNEDINVATTAELN